MTAEDWGTHAPRVLVSAPSPKRLGRDCAALPVQE